MKVSSEVRYTKKVHDFIYGDLAKDIEAWRQKIKKNVYKLRINELDDNETDHIEVDLVMDFYI
jgi:hypothetical protein